MSVEIHIKFDTIRYSGKFPPNTTIWQVLYTLCPSTLVFYTDPENSSSSWLCLASGLTEGQFQNTLSDIFFPPSSFWIIPAITIGGQSQVINTLDLLIDTELSSYNLPRLFCSINLIPSSYFENPISCQIIEDILKQTEKAQGVILTASSMTNHVITIPNHSAQPVTLQPATQSTLSSNTTRPTDKKPATTSTAANTPATTVIPPTINNSNTSKQAKQTQVAAPARSTNINSILPTSVTPQSQTQTQTQVSTLPQLNIFVFKVFLICITNSYYYHLNRLFFPYVSASYSTLSAPSPMQFSNLHQILYQRISREELLNIFQFLHTLLTTLQKQQLSKQTICQKNNYKIAPSQQQMYQSICCLPQLLLPDIIYPDGWQPNKPISTNNSSIYNENSVEIHQKYKFSPFVHKLPSTLVNPHNPLHATSCLSVITHKCTNAFINDSTTPTSTTAIKTLCDELSISSPLYPNTLQNNSENDEKTSQQLNEPFDELSESRSTLFLPSSPNAAVFFDKPLPSAYNDTRNSIDITNPTFRARCGPVYREILALLLFLGYSFIPQTLVQYQQVIGNDNEQSNDIQQASKSSTSTSGLLPAATASPKQTSKVLLPNLTASFPLVLHAARIAQRADLKSSQQIQNIAYELVHLSNFQSDIFKLPQIQFTSHTSSQPHTIPPLFSPMNYQLWSQNSIPSEYIPTRLFLPSFVDLRSLSTCLRVITSFINVLQPNTITKSLLPFFPSHIADTASSSSTSSPPGTVLPIALCFDRHTVIHSKHVAQAHHQANMQAKYSAPSPAPTKPSGGLFNLNSSTGRTKKQQQQDAAARQARKAAFHKPSANTVKKPEPKRLDGTPGRQLAPPSTATNSNQDGNNSTATDGNETIENNDIDDIEILHKQDNTYNDGQKLYEIVKKTASVPDAMSFQGYKFRHYQHTIDGVIIHNEQTSTPTQTPNTDDVIVSKNGGFFNALKIPFFSSTKNTSNTSPPPLSGYVNDQYQQPLLNSPNSPPPPYNVVVANEKSSNSSNNSASEEDIQLLHAYRVHQHRQHQLLSRGVLGMETLRKGALLTRDAALRLYLSKHQIKPYSAIRIDLGTLQEFNSKTNTLQTAIDPTTKKPYENIVLQGVFFAYENYRDIFSWLQTFMVPHRIPIEDLSILGQHAYLQRLPLEIVDQVISYLEYKKQLKASAATSASSTSSASNTIYLNTYFQFALFAPQRQIYSTYTAPNIRCSNPTVQSTTNALQLVPPKNILFSQNSLPTDNLYSLYDEVQMYPFYASSTATFQAGNTTASLSTQSNNLFPPPGTTPDSPTRISAITASNAAIAQAQWYEQRRLTGQKKGSSREIDREQFLIVSHSNKNDQISEVDINKDSNNINEINYDSIQLINPYITIFSQQKAFLRLIPRLAEPEVARYPSMSLATDNCYTWAKNRYYRQVGRNDIQFPIFLSPYDNSFSTPIPRYIEQEATYYQAVCKKKIEQNAMDDEKEKNNKNMFDVFETSSPISTIETTTGVASTMTDNVDDDDDIETKKQFDLTSIEALQITIDALTNEQASFNSNEDLIWISGIAYHRSLLNLPKTDELPPFIRRLN